MMRHVAILHLRADPLHTERLRCALIVLLGGLIAGTFDIILATAYWAVKGVPPYRVLQSVATGLLGRASFQGGTRTAVLGLTLHFLIAVSMAYLYYFAARMWPVLHQHPWICGAVYGMLVYLVMNYVVIPLSAATPRSKNVPWVTTNFIGHMLLIGIPIALAARWSLRVEKQSAARLTTV